MDLGGIGTAIGHILALFYVKLGKPTPNPVLFVKYQLVTTNAKQFDSKMMQIFQVWPAFLQGIYLMMGLRYPLQIITAT